MSRIRILVGDALERLRDLPEESVHTVVTSPPYWGLRDYGVEGQIGLEAEPEAFVGRLVEVFRELRRVIRSDGTLWLNIGDSYAGSWGGRGRSGDGTPMSPSSLAAQQIARSARQKRAPTLPRKSGIKNKDLVGIPWMLAFALRADGWWLRAENIWHKPNGLPESVLDRPGRSHETVFLLSKSAQYFYDQEAVRTEHAPKTLTHRGGGSCGRADSQDALGEVASGNWSGRERVVDAHGAALRTVWSLATQRSDVEHFALMPPKLAERCILLGTSAGGCCSTCGAPLERRVELGGADLERQLARGGDAEGRYEGRSTKAYAEAGLQVPGAVKARILAGMRERKTLGWDPSCSCPPGPPAPCVVLDPFGGAGTTALVAARCQRDAVLVELNPEYAELARARLAEDMPLLTSVEVA